MYSLGFGQLLSVVVTIPILVVCGFADWKTRCVPNKYTSSVIFLGLILIIVTGQLLEEIILHITAIVVSILVGQFLHQIGAFGGADARLLLFTSMTSPGILFSVWKDPVLEVLVAVGLETVVMLIGGLVIMTRERITRPIPLIPFLLLGYLLTQVLALF